MTNPEIKVEFLPSPRGYFDRKCPKCDLIFAVHLSDFKKHKGTMYCPMCGFSKSANHADCFTSVQFKEMKERGHAQASEWMHQQVSNIFSKFNRPSSPSKSFVTIELEYIPAKRPLFRKTPVIQPKEWELDIQCPKCNKRYSVIGTAYFCSFCGKNNIEENFEKSLEIIQNKLNFKQLFKSDLAKMDKNMAEDFARSILEKTVAEVVSAFQKLAESLIKKHTDKEYKVNDFQIISKGDLIFKENTGKSYKDWLIDTEYSFLDLMFQRRHLLEHNVGIVDEKYLEKTKDISYRQGQRFVMNAKDISKFIDIVKKLSVGLKNI